VAEVQSAVRAFVRLDERVSRLHRDVCLVARGPSLTCIASRVLECLREHDRVANRLTGRLECPTRKQHELCQAAKHSSISLRSFFVEREHE